MNFLQTFVLNKQKLVLVLAIVVSFGLGFAAAALRISQTSAQTNSPTSILSKTQTNNTPITPYNQAKSNKSATPTNVNKSCVVKGKIAKNKAKTYYLAEQAGYARLKANQCFSTEQEAMAAGFTKSTAKLSPIGK